MSDAAVKQALDTLTNPNATQPEKDKLTNLTKDPKIQDAANKTGINLGPAALNNTLKDNKTNLTDPETIKNITKNGP